MKAVFSTSTILDGSVSSQTTVGSLLILEHVFTSGPIYWVDLMKRTKIPTDFTMGMVGIMEHYVITFSRPRIV
jgi:hypothetical protein